ncbi:putative uv radiation resistance protein [Lasiodiplodia theobromae]|uniref:UV radiation resistance protein n=1 Tax=Lasiodiplodia theobromae TaxID=45133 RepID=UPI0015C3A9D1|nr:UV radiation resistance protein [Lasiodiplodia theobromae]KAF4538643.1 UV radiation resistance protein [Lasiodiplodia theobromae]KAF9637663.1 putative uv radiation resistance protein [Lasiodiplodia theobromae]
MPGSSSGPGDQHPPQDLPRRERPWLLPYNRKIRHLQGITIRNLTLVQATGRPRRGTIDDDAIPSSLKTPTKALAQRESRKLEHSRSSNDLRSNDLKPISESAVTEGPKPDNNDPPAPDVSLRPAIARMRRRSTMEWSGASPLQRQKKLEDVTGGRMANTFFSLHVDGVDEPVYVSEEVEKAMNPDFRFFDLHPWGPAVTRLDELTVKVWVKSDTMTEHQHLLDIAVNFRSLQFIGKSNCILFHFTDGIYTSFMDLASEAYRLDWTTAPAKSTSAPPQPTSSYDQLMRLSTLDDCIQDALATRDRLTTEINAIIERNDEALSTVNHVPEAQERLKQVEALVASQRRRLEAARKKRNDLQAGIKYRRETMRKGREMQTQTLEDIEHGKEQLEERKITLQQVQDEILGHRRRVCEDLLKIYPIEPIPGRSLYFTIKGLPLPNSEFDDVREDVTGAALGYVAQVVAHLSVYLSLPLAYPIDPKASHSTIDDPISMTNGPRTYPLFMRGAVRYRFEYGVFLLNKNIELLSNELGLKLLDIRQTLPNLKYLLYVATAGKGDIPARKAGGFRALLRYPGTPNDSRRASVDSTVANGAAPQENGGLRATGSTTLASPTKTTAPDKGEAAAAAASLVKGGGTDNNRISFAATPSFKIHKPAAALGSVS